jgi:RNA polymerase sigma factor (TIGR02999 family)
MSEVTRLLDAAAAGDRQAAADLLPLVYDELRQLAASHMAAERAGHTLDATALVHEAYLRLVGPADDRRWDGRGHFFAAAAEAMRRILVDHARRRQAAKRGGAAAGVRVDLERLSTSEVGQDLWIDLDEALTALASTDAEAAELATLRVFGGLSVEEAAQVLEMPRATAFRAWTYARAWLTAALSDKSMDS